MTKIDCFLKERIDSTELEVIESLNNDYFKENYFHLKGNKLEINVFFLDTIEKDKIKYEFASKKLPLVFINDKLIKEGALLSDKELSEILDIGISIQEL